MRKEHEINIPSTLGSRSVSEPGTTNDLNAMSREDTINSPSTSDSANLPCADLLHGNREEYIKICLPLYEASITGDWQAAKVIIDERPELVRFAITESYETPLHVAASANITKLTEVFFENLVNRMENEELELKMKGGENVFRLVAASGSIKMAEILLNKHKSPWFIADIEGFFPLTISAKYGNHDMTRYLYDVSEKTNGEEWTNKARGLFLCCCTQANIFDIALNLLTGYPEILIDPWYSKIVLADLAEKPDALNKREDDMIWKSIDPIFSRRHMKKGLSETHHHGLKLLKEVLNITIRVTELDIIDLLIGLPNDDEEYLEPSRILFVAAEIGNTRFLIEVIRMYPHVIWMQNDDGHTILDIAIMHRHEGIYNLLYELGSRKLRATLRSDKRGNTMLHLVGMTSKKIQLQSMSGASLLMQRELLWFQDVEKMLPPFRREEQNIDGQTAYQIFFENNKDQVSRGLSWMKDCMVVATLIVTVAFAIAFTVPGGYNQDNGYPVFIHERTFLVFIIADAISLFSSTTSLLVFLSILTSRYGQRDFLYSLPRKLMIGLVTLFISVAAMMATFAASFFVLYRNELKWVPIIISTFAAMPVIVFGVLQFPLCLDMFRSMYDSRYLFNPRKRMLYNKNPEL